MCVALHAIAHLMSSLCVTLTTHTAQHWYLAAGFTFTLLAYGAVDGLRDDVKKSAYNQKVLAGQPPFTGMRWLYFVSYACPPCVQGSLSLILRSHTLETTPKAALFFPFTAGGH